MGTYTIDGCNEMFLTLQEAKKHIWLAYTPKECIKELTDTCIVGWNVILSIKQAYVKTIAV